MLESTTTKMDEEVNLFLRDDLDWGWEQSVR
jgi:hypothetical protein